MYNNDNNNNNNNNNYFYFYFFIIIISPPKYFFFLSARGVSVYSNWRFGVCENDFLSTENICRVMTVIISGRRDASGPTLFAVSALNHRLHILDSDRLPRRDCVHS